ncbi:MAG TPA: VWA domain-containing protein [Kiritimatiellae bacterium]|nr:VWA domain-containing protein [Kiritimatiellia bacterium]
MRLADPVWLFAILLVPVLVWFRYRRGHSAAVFYSSSRDLVDLPGSLRIRLHLLLPFVYTAALLSVIVAASRPQKALGTRIIPSRAIDIALVMDISTSMRAEDMGDEGERLSRIEAARRVAKDFIRRRPHDRIALIAFAAMPYTMAPLTLDHDWLITRLEELRTGMIEDATAIGDALGSALNRLRSSKAKSRLVVLLTDGVNNAGILDPLLAAELAGSLGIKVYTVGVGTRGWAPYPVRDTWGKLRYVPQRVEIDENLLRDIAVTTGGRYFRAADIRTMRQAYAEIDRLEKTELKVKYYTRYEELFPWALLAAVLLLAAEKILALTVAVRIP